MEQITIPDEIDNTTSLVTEIVIPVHTCSCSFEVVAPLPSPFTEVNSMNDAQYCK